MILKAFLSHSSKDKDYVEKVAQTLTTNWCTYDKFTFEEASFTAEEIVKHIESNGIFVFFISKNSLASEWVNLELVNVHNLTKNGEYKKILPIIIDDRVDHTDEQIPDWLRESYNIQPIRKYKKAVHRIRQELIRISWLHNTNKRQKDTFFVGRNMLVDSLETRHRENFYPPAVVAASGIDGIGRRSLLREYLQKVGMAEKSKYIPTITLEINESIEDLILKLDDLGLSNTSIDIKDVTLITIDEKIELLLSILKDICDEKELVLVEDNGCLILPDRSINEWFHKVLQDIHDKQSIKSTVLIMASKYKLKKHILLSCSSLNVIDVPELEAKEIDWVFKELLKIHDISLIKEEYDFVRKLLYGHPEQILFAVKILKLEDRKSVV